MDVGTPVLRILVNFQCAPLQAVCEVNAIFRARHHRYQYTNIWESTSIGSVGIVGRIDNMYLGRLIFRSRITVSRDSHIAILIGLDCLKQFQGEINLKDSVLRLYIKDKS